MLVNHEEYTNSSRYSYYVNDVFYAELIAELQDCGYERELFNQTIRLECEALLLCEARWLDEGKFDAWLGLFTSNCLYWIPTTLGGGDPRREVAIAFDDRRRLEDRVFWLECGFAYAQTPRSRTSRMISNIEIFQSTKEQEIIVRSNFVIHEFRQGQMKTYAGWYRHKLHQQDDTWKIALKQVNLLDCDQGHENLTFLL